MIKTSIEDDETVYCEFCGTRQAELLVSGYETCRGCVRRIKKLKQEEKEDEE